MRGMGVCNYCDSNFCRKARIDCNTQFQYSRRVSIKKTKGGRMKGMDFYKIIYIEYIIM